jgi:DNA modification methylase
MSGVIYNGDALTVLRRLSPESVQCCVTSPPYWGLRDYGHEDQIGNEETPTAFVEALVAVFREVRRALKDDGVLWLNLGDSYCSTDKWGGGGHNTGKQTVADDGEVPSWAVRARKAPIEGVKPKDLVGIPWMVAFALRADGWWLRSDVIWSKPNGMPESVKDRPTRAHEYIFLLSKSETYFYNAAAIAEPSTNGDHPRKGVPGSVLQAPGQIRHAGISRWRENGYEGTPPGTPRNARSVWTIATQPYPDAHFATFPEALAQRCILAGSRPGDTVLDPFAGAGTTCAVADAHQRAYIGIELNPEYAELARCRIIADGAPLFSGAQDGEISQ